MYRNRRILDEARLHPCQNCGADDGTIVAAHSNQAKHGKGMQMKGHDVFVAYLCWMCHHQLDQGFLWSREQKAEIWQRSHEKTVPLFIHLLDKEGRGLLCKAAGKGETCLLPCPGCSKGATRGWEATEDPEEQL